MDWTLSTIKGMRRIAAASFLAGLCGIVPTAQAQVLLALQHRPRRNVEAHTVEELRLFLTEQFRLYVREPEIYLRPVRYRPIRIYVGGEVRRPGY